MFRNFNTRYVVHAPSGPDPERVRALHRSAECNFAYIVRENLVDRYGPTPNFAGRSDLVASGRAAPVRALKPCFEGPALWRALDELSVQRRPDQATAAHCVGSLPEDGTASEWMQLAIAFAEDEFAAKGMICDWAIHFRAEGLGQPPIHPHVHFLATLRSFDRDPGRRNNAWLSTRSSRHRLADSWYELTGVWPSPMPLAA